LFFLVLAAGCFNFAEAHEGNHLRWHTNYKEAVAESQSSGKPIVLFFTGSDWCMWCKKLDKEVFQTQEFNDLAGNKFVFVEVDFPHSSQQAPDVVKQNDDLLKKYQIQGYPTVIILDAKSQRQIGSTGYKPGGGKAYAEHLSQVAGIH
jgi:protein disulfide-isomerase